MRETIASQSSGVLASAISLGEFYQKAVFIPNACECASNERVLYMQRAVCETKNADKLHFPKEFFEFMQNKEYLFKFFKELSHEKVSIDMLDISDIRAEYTEHFEILKELLDNYKAKLSELGLYDEITMPGFYEINENYLERFDSIEIDIDGSPSKYELEILSKIAKITKVYLNFKATEFNQKTLNAISSLCGENFVTGFSYKLDLSNGKILPEFTAQIPQNSQILLKGFSLRALQAGYIFEKISTFMKSGISPENIVVIVPDESFAITLKILDEKIASVNGSHRMLNFAMGKKLSTSPFGVALAKISQCIKENINPNFTPKYHKTTDENGERSERDVPNEFDLFFKEIGVGAELFAKFSENFERNASFATFSALINELLACEKIYDVIVAQKIKEPLFTISVLNEKLKEQNFTFSNLLDLFLQELQNVKLDDVRGGKVTVMGILESRGLSFDGVIIVDFNDDLVPKRVDGEMFLNSVLRAKAGLISHNDRENLQRFYYHSLIGGARKVAISYLDTAEKSPSRFLKNFTATSDVAHENGDYLRIFADDLYEKPKLGDESNHAQKHDFFEHAVSFSRFDTFMTCKRKYYYAYILGIEEGLKFGEDNAKMGNILHKAFENYYAQNLKFDYEKFVEFYDKQARAQNADLYSANYDLIRVKRLAPVLSEHEKSWSFKESEKNYDSVKFNEFATLKGRIDRIDINESGDKYILDYKRGGYSASSAQLKFYKALIGDESCESGYVSLKDSKIIQGKNPQGTPKDTPAFEILNEAFADIKCECESEVEFDKSEKSSDCGFCPYKIICKGEIND